MPSLVPSGVWLFEQPDRADAGHPERARTERMVLEDAWWYGGADQALSPPVRAALGDRADRVGGVVVATEDDTVVVGLSLARALWRRAPPLWWANLYEVRDAGGSVGTKVVRPGGMPIRHFRRESINAERAELRDPVDVDVAVSVVCPAWARRIRHAQIAGVDVLRGVVLQGPEVTAPMDVAHDPDQGRSLVGVVLEAMTDAVRDRLAPTRFNGLCLHMMLLGQLVDMGVRSSAADADALMAWDAAVATFASFPGPADLWARFITLAPVRERLTHAVLTDHAAESDGGHPERTQRKM